MTKPITNVICDCHRGDSYWPNPEASTDIPKRFVVATFIPYAVRRRAHHRLGYPLTGAWASLLNVMVALNDQGKRDAAHGWGGVWRVFLRRRR